MAITAEILTHLRADATQFKAEMASAQASTQGTASGFDKLASVGKVAFFSLGAAAVALGVVGVKAAMEQEEATARLAQAIKNAGGSYDQYSDAIGRAEKHAISLGFQDEDLDAGLTKLVNSTKDVKKSIDLMNLAEDVARGRHIDLGAATDILVKVEAGRVGLLGRLGINTKDATGATISQADAIKKLTDLYGGQASAYTQTFAGRIEVLKAQLNELAERIGFVLIPIIEGLASGFAAFFGFLDQHRGVAIALAAVIGGPLVAAMVAYIAKVTIAMALRISQFWTEAITGVRILAGVLYDGAAAWGVFGAAESTAALSGASFVAAIALPVAAAVGLGVVLNQLTGGKGSFGAFTDSLNEAGKAGSDLGNQLVKQADAVAFLAPPIDTLRKSLADLEAKQKAIVQSYKDGKISQEEAAAAYKKQGAAADVVSKAIDDQKKALAENKVVADGVVQTYGIEIPAGYNISTQAMGTLQKKIDEVSISWGEGATAAANMLLSLDNSGSVFLDAAKNFDTLYGSISSFTDVSKAKIGDLATFLNTDTTKAMEVFVDTTTQQASDWATELEALVQKGVDVGIIQQFARAGPESKPQLDAVTAAVNEKGVDWINAASEKSRAVALAVAIEMAKMNLIVQATMQDLQTGGNAKLERLRTGSDLSLSLMASEAERQIGRVGTAVNNIPGQRTVTIDVHDNATTRAQQIWNYIDSLPALKQITVKVVGGIT